MYPNFYDLSVQTNVVRIRPSENALERKHFDVRKRKIFREKILGTLGIKRKDIEDYEAHHIVPLFLGGTSTDWNLCMAEPYLHYLIHYFIDCQVQGIEIGEKRTILIPKKFDCAKWDLYGDIGKPMRPVGKNGKLYVVSNVL